MNRKGLDVYLLFTALGTGNCFRTDEPTQWLLSCLLLKLFYDIRDEPTQGCKNLLLHSIGLHSCILLKL